MSEFIISSEQLERLIEAIEHNTGREINRIVIDGKRATEIVRCKDCENYEYREYLGRSYCLGEYATEPDGFCAWGERREL